MQNEDQVGTYKQAEAKKDIAEGFKRSPIVAGQRSVSIGLLSNPKGKLNRGMRKTLLHLQSNLIRPIEPVEPKSFPVKFALKLTTLKLTQLVRRQKKFARMASTAKHVLAKMDPVYSRLRSAVEGQQEAALNCFKQVCAEIKARALACEGKLAAAE